MAGKNTTLLKTKRFLWRIEHYLLSIPFVFSRLITHLYDGLRAILTPKELSIKKSCFWLTELVFFTTDLLPVPQLIDTIFDLVKYSNRGLNQREVELALETFGPDFPTNLVVINDSPWLWPIKRVKAFVLLHSIHSNGPMSDHTLIHELAHIWQYREMGSVYIPRALKAQQSQEAYSYQSSELRIRHFSSFNLEQQAEIIADHYLESNLASMKSRYDEEIV